MKRKIIITDDGSTTIHLPDLDEQYHSKHGAIQEAYHVFVNTGLGYLLKQMKPNPLKILEIGFGTGLNAFITLLESDKNKIPISFTGVEAYPISSLEIEKLNYPLLLNSTKAYFKKLHQSEWEQQISISTHFSILKRMQFFSEINDKNNFHLIYFDAFGARVQPELWTEQIFKKMYIALKKGGVLVTYSAKGSVRRAMQTVGFVVERLPGPPGKREMLRARKI